MRKLLFVAAIISLVMYSCKKNEVQSEDYNVLTEEELDQIAALGFNKGGALKVDGGYIVEGDIFISTDQLNGGVSDSHELIVANEEHYRTTNLVTGLPRVITVRVNSSLPSSYVTATNNAIARYNALGLRITFQRVTSGGNIVINGINTTQYLASAGFPSGGNPYGTVTVSRSYLDTWNANTVTSIIAHEIGHCIGFRHTDYMNRAYSCGGSAYNEGSAGVGAHHIPGTPTGASANSWMLACIGNGTNRPFTSSDQTALHYIY